MPSKAYGTVAYLVDTNSDRSNIFLSKARVAPCKEDRLTIPKLEVAAALIGCRLMNHINSQFSTCKFFLWSDSKLALSWICSD